MLNYIINGLRTAHPTVWWTAGFVSIALVLVLSWNAYKSANQKPRAALSIVQLV
jgi:hypothetical protein